MASLGETHDFIMGPVVRGLCTMESLRNGALTLVDFAIMNEAMMVENENQWRAQDAAARRKK